MSEWEVYKKPTTKQRSKKYVSITKSKTFGLPRPFVDEYKITPDMKVVILYNETNKKIALRFSTSNPEFGYAVRLGKKPAHGAIIVANKFFEDKNINSAQYSGHYDFEKIAMTELGFLDMKGHAFVISLSKSDTTQKTKSPSQQSEPVVNF